MISLGSWEAEETNVGAITSALADLRRGEQRTATRTAVVNLVVVATDAAEVERAEAATHRLAGRHPGRTIIVRPTGDGEGPGRMDASVCLQGADADGLPVWWEELDLRVMGGLIRHLDSVIEPLVIADLPVAVWFTGRLPVADEPLVHVADALLVDSRQAEPGAFASLARLERARGLVDLSWIRLQPWRLLLASMFETPETRPFLRSVKRARIAGKDGPRRLLAGWLAGQLGLRPSAFTLVPSRHVGITLTASIDGQDATFTVERRDGERLVRSVTNIVGGPRHEDVVALVDDSLPWSLSQGLTHLRRDRVYGQALTGTLGFVP
jgi:glucose-6-phosphate dehydrogenase assembly protein OpcA